MVSQSTPCRHPHFSIPFPISQGYGPMLLHQRHRIFFLLFLTLFFHPWFLKKWRTFRWEQWSTQTTMYKVLRTSRQRKFHMTSQDHFQNFLFFDLFFYALNFIKFQLVIIWKESHVSVQYPRISDKNFTTNVVKSIFIIII